MRSRAETSQTTAVRDRTPASSGGALQFADRRNEAAVQARLEDLAQGGTHAAQLRALQQKADAVPLERQEGADGEEPLQGRFAPVQRAAAAEDEDAVQLMPSGSHGKHLHFTVTTVTIRNTVTNARRFVNAHHDEDLGVVPSHGQGPAHKTAADAGVIAAGVANLAANEVIADVLWRHYTAR